MKKIALSVFVIAQATFSFSQNPCSDLFFSEYIEGTSSNKALEIYNPTIDTIDLSNYHIYRYVNGSTIPGDTLLMTGLLAPGDVYTAVNAGADSLELEIFADTLHTITYYNGDDALELYNGNILIDVIGEKGVDPGVNWVVGLGATSEYTLVRMSSILNGTTSWTVGATQWDIFPQDDFTHFNAHTMQSCGSASIQNENNWEVSLYPNPSSDYLNINSQITNYSIQILDITGKIAINKNNLNKNEVINLVDLLNGIYIVKLSNGLIQLTQKIIVKK